MALPQIHLSATITGEARLADDVTIGPNCTLDGTLGAITIGSGTRLIAAAHLCGPLTLGDGNTLYPCAALGFAPQDLKWDANVAGAGLVIGSGNTFREGATIHRATSHETPTRVGDHCYWMAGSHAGHDCHIGSKCVFANGTLLAGHVQVDDRVITGGGLVVHQHCRIGQGAMLSGGVGMSLDVPPRFMLTGNNIVGSVNLIGLRRSGMSSEQIETIKWVYRTLYRQGLLPKAALEILRERGDDPLVSEYITFIEMSKRGICPARGKAIRGAGG
jgi:UDP-N-acetylglucosamine acyltransferase